MLIRLNECSYVCYIRILIEFKAGCGVAITNVDNELTPREHAINPRRHAVLVRAPHKAAAMLAAIVEVSESGGRPKSARRSASVSLWQRPLVNGHMFFVSRER